MKTKKLLFINLFLFCTILICGYNIQTKAAGKNYTLANPIYDTDYYEGDFEILDKGYYIIVGSGDLWSISISGNAKTYNHYGEITSSIFKQNITVESGYESAIDEIVNEFNSEYYVKECELSVFVRVDNYALLTFGEGEGCLLFTYAALIENTNTSNYHVVNYDSKTPLSTIESKYSYSDNLDSKEKLNFITSTNYHPNIYPGIYSIYIEVTDTSGNSTTLLDYIYVHDFTAPTITTNKEYYEIEVNSTTLTSDDILGSLTIKDNVTTYSNLEKNIVDTYKSQYNKVGDYSITYSATDSASNTTTKVITIKVKDSTAPSIALKDGGDTIYTDRDLSIQEIYELLDINDNYDDMTFDDISITCTSDGLEGVEYQIIVTATDSNNNTSQATFTYYINDTTPPSITVRDTVYLEKGRKYTSEELINILRAAGLISNDATTVNIIGQELISSTNEEDIYTLSFEQVMSDGSLKEGSVTLKYQKETNNNYVYYIVIASSIILLTGLVIFIKKHKKKVNAKN